MTIIKFNINAQRYVDGKTGKFIKESYVLESLDKYRIQRGLVVDGLAAKLIENRDYDKFLSDAAKELKNLWFVNFVVGKGGIKQVTNKDLASFNQELQKELTLSFDLTSGRSYGLQELTTQLEMGEISEAQFNARLKAYVRGGKKAYWQAVGSRQDLPYMQRHLNGNDHCPECIEYESVGMVAKGTLPLPGERCSCSSNCLCTVTYHSLKQYKAFLRTQLQSGSLEEAITSQ